MTGGQVGKGVEVGAKSVMSARWLCSVLRCVRFFSIALLW